MNTLTLGQLRQRVADICGHNLDQTNVTEIDFTAHGLTFRVVDEEKEELNDQLIQTDHELGEREAYIRRLKEDKKCLFVIICALCGAFILLGVIASASK